MQAHVLGASGAHLSRSLAARPRASVVRCSCSYSFAELKEPRPEPGQRRVRALMKREGARQWPHWASVFCTSSARWPRALAHVALVLWARHVRVAALAQLSTHVVFCLHTERALRDLVVGMTKMTEKQLKAVQPVCGEAVVEAVKVAARLPRTNQVRCAATILRICVAAPRPAR